MAKSMKDLMGLTLAEVSEVAPMAAASELAADMINCGVWNTARYAAKRGVSLEVALKAARIRATAQRDGLNQADLIDVAAGWLEQVLTTEKVIY